MKTHWTALGIGVLIGAVLGYMMGQKAIGASVLPSGANITGTQNAPFQAKISRR